MATRDNFIITYVGAALAKGVTLKDALSQAAIELRDLCEWARKPMKMNWCRQEVGRIMTNVTAPSWEQRKG